MSLQTRRPDRLLFWDGSESVMIYTPMEHGGFAGTTRLPKGRIKSDD